MITVLSLGATPLANALLTREQLDHPEPRYPLVLAFCQTCTLVQITETVPPETLFREYVYFSSVSEALVRHAEENVRNLISSRNLGRGSMVIEVASNDGYLLQHYRRAGIPVLGIEPAMNIARAAEEKGIRTLCEFFGAELARQLAAQGYRADVIHANNVLAHVADLNGVVDGITLLLKDDGVAVIEVPYVKDLIDGVEFDTIYHEHLCYFSFTALERLFRRHRLAIVDVQRLSIHGGSLRIFATRSDAVSCPGDNARTTRQLLAEEADWGVDNPVFYSAFGASVERLRHQLLTLLRGLKAEGKRIAAYGASAKGSTLLNYCGIGRETLEFVVDRSKVKQGRFTPGTHLHIEATERLVELMPDYVLLLTWNFVQEILTQQAEYLQRGGRFITPLPDPQITEWAG